jgi:Tol biopolymer transport system component
LGTLVSVTPSRTPTNTRTPSNTPTPTKTYTPSPTATPAPIQLIGVQCLNYVLFTAKSAGGANTSIFQLNVDNPKTPLVNISKDATIDNNQWARSPDSRWVVYSSQSDGHYKLYVASSDGKQSPRAITDGGGGDDSVPVWGALNLIAFVRTTGNKSAIFTVDPKVGTVKAVPIIAAKSDTNPTWSSDGKTLAFVEMDTAGDGGGPTKILLYSVATGQVTALDATSTSVIYAISWSPRNNRIAYISNNGAVNAVQTISVIDITTGSVKVLVNDATVKTGISWSTDGTNLGYLSVVNGAAQGFVVNVLANPPQPIVIAKTVQYPGGNLGWDCNGRLIYTAPNGTGTNLGLYSIANGPGATPKLLTDPGLSITGIVGATGGGFEIAKP